MNLEELKRRYEQRNVNYMAEADFMEAVSIQFPAIVAKLEAAQRLRDDLMQIMAPTVSNMREAANQSHMVAMAIAAFDKEQQ